MASGKKALSIPYFNYSPGQNGADFVYTVPDVGLGAVGVMDVAGAMPGIEHLAGLGQGAEQWVVAALTLLLAVEAHCRAICETAGGECRATEIQSDAGQTQITNSLQSLLPVESAQLVHTPVVHPRLRTADRRHIRQTIKSRQVAHDGVLPVMPHILEPSTVQQQVNDQQHYAEVMTKD